MLKQFKASNDSGIPRMGYTSGFAMELCSALERQSNLQEKIQVNPTEVSGFPWDVGNSPIELEHLRCGL